MIQIIRENQDTAVPMYTSMSILNSAHRPRAPKKTSSAPAAISSNPHIFLTTLLLAFLFLVHRFSFHTLISNLSSLAPSLSAMESKIPDFLAEQQAKGTPETQTYLLTFEDFWERKLWHQLTDALVEFFKLPESAPQRLAFFKTFVLSFADRINQLKFVALGLMAATECAGKLSIWMVFR